MAADVAPGCESQCAGGSHPAGLHRRTQSPPPVSLGAHPVQAAPTASSQSSSTGRPAIARARGTNQRQAGQRPAPPKLCSALTFQCNLSSVNHHAAEKAAAQPRLGETVLPTPSYEDTDKLRILPRLQEYSSVTPEHQPCSQPSLTPVAAIAALQDPPAAPAGRAGSSGLAQGFQNTAL